MYLKHFIVFLFLVLGFLKGFSFPDCDSILSIQKFEQLDDREKVSKVHPYLSMAFCQKDKEEKYLALYLDTFFNHEAVSQRLEELKLTLYTLILKDNANQFFNFFGKLLIHIEERYPNIQEELVFINIKFTYLNHRYGNTKACSYLYNFSEYDLSDKAKNTDLYLHYLKLSKCAESSDNYNMSVFYLLEGLDVAKDLAYPDNLLKSGHLYNALSKRYYGLKDYKNTEKYADSSIYKFLPDFTNKIGLAVGYENKALAVYQLYQDHERALAYLLKAQKIYKKVENISRYHYVERLKAEVFMTEQPSMATQHLFNHINYFYARKRHVHYANAWLLADKLISENQLEYLEYDHNVKVAHHQIIDTLTTLLPHEELKNQLEIASALIKYYSLNMDKDSLIKYNQLQNEFEAERSKMYNKQRQTSLGLYLTNYEKEQELASLNLLSQKRSYQNKLLIGLSCFAVIGLFFYYLYKRKQKQVMLTKLQLRETEHQKLRAEQGLKEELILRKEQDEKMLQLAYENEVKRKQLLQLQLKEKQKEVEAAQLEKQLNANLLQEVFSALKDESVNNADHLIRKLRSNEIITRHNDGLKELFKSISPTLMESLEQVSKNLTEQDILYCALIRQNYTTKQIANFLNISPKSVNQHKYRLKKKLNIDRNVAITDFLKKLS